LGGYVKFAGDANAASFPDPETMARIPQAERAGLFHFAPLWKRALIVSAGPLANFVLAIGIFAVVFATIGRPASDPVVDAVISGSAAEKAGIRVGDRIVAIDGHTIEAFSDIPRIVSLAAGDTLAITLERGTERLDVTAMPERKETSDGFGGTQRVGILGIQRNLRSGDVTFHRHSPVQAVIEGARETGAIIERTLTYIGRLFKGRETFDQLSGPVKIVQIAGAASERGGLPLLINLAAVLSVSIGLFNLFPVPILDGGHLVFFAIEAIRGRPLSPRTQEMAFRVGLVFIIALFIFVTTNDIG